MATALAPAAFIPSSRDRATIVVAALALAALVLAPWGPGGGSALMRALSGATSQWPLIAAAAAVLLFACWGRDTATALVAALGLAWAFGAGFAAGPGAPAFGIGAALALGALTVCLARALARLGMFRGDVAVATIVVVIGALLIVFIFYPVTCSLVAAVEDAQGRFAPGLISARLLTSDIWGLGCFGGGTRCGVAINSALLAAIVGLLSTLL
ncbi:MAG: hypothetical protein E6H60_00360, partial [Betaproteobacteria bacterium]